MGEKIMVEKTMEFNGVTHTIKTELATLITWTDWIKNNKTTEQYIEWLANRNNPSTMHNIWYAEWVADQQITHTII